MAQKASPVKKIRTAIGVSQRQLADAFEVHHTLIANLEMNLIDITEDNEELKGKVNLIFEKLARLSGTPKEELLKEQAQCTKEQKVSMRVRVLKQIGEVCEKLVGTKPTNAAELEQLIYEIEMRCIAGDHCRSPLNLFRETGGITQRQFAQAANVSQPLVARIEGGELSFNGINTGHKVLGLLIEGLGIDIYSNAYDFDPYHLYVAVYKCQEEFIHKNALQSKKKVEVAFEMYRKIQKQNT